MKTNQTPAGVPYQVRQGDVFLERVDNPAAFSVDGMQPALPEDGRVVMAHGEVTGHSHVLDASADGDVRAAVPVSGQFWTPSGNIDDSGVLKVEQDVHIKHDTHGALPVPTGQYTVIKQQEYEPAAPPRRVLD